jgi:hypothetical protein
MDVIGGTVLKLIKRLEDSDAEVLGTIVKAMAELAKNGL